VSPSLAAEEDAPAAEPQLETAAAEPEFDAADGASAAVMIVVSV